MPPSRQHGHSLEQPPRGCRQVAGSYADHGEMPDSAVQPSLTRELFGHHTEWPVATRGAFSLPRTGLLDVAVWSRETTLFNRTLATQAGDFVCRLAV